MFVKKKNFDSVFFIFSRFAGQPLCFVLTHRMKERVKKMSTQLRDEEEERNNLQVNNSV